MLRTLLPRMKYDDGFWPNTLAIGYAFVGYGGGLYLTTLSLPSLALTVTLNLLGTLWLAHAMVIAAYLMHECAHNSLFARNEDNARLGYLLNWLSGACYGDYEDIRFKHFRHHVDKADVVSFDYREVIRRSPRLTRWVQALEWAYIPAVEVIMHLYVLILPFRLERRRKYRVRVLFALAVRLPLFALLAWYAPKAFVLYLVAYMLMMTVLRFMDAFQHTYEIFPTLEQARGEGGQKFDRDYEEQHTYSNPISLSHPWLNLLTLNFGYHNAHHAKPTQPWYRLPRLHRELYGTDYRQVISFRTQVKAFHRFRVERVLNADEGQFSLLEDQGENLVGVNGVSFLTTH